MFCETERLPVHVDIADILSVVLFDYNTATGSDLSSSLCWKNMLCRSARAAACRRSVLSETILVCMFCAEAMVNLKT